MKVTNHSRSTFGRTSLPLAASVAVVVLQTGVVMGASPLTSPRERISINDDWRFRKGDPAGLADNLAYPRGKGAVPTSGIAAYILPTGNGFIADPAKHYVKPDGNFGGAITYVDPAFSDAEWRQLDLPHDFGVDGAFIPPGQAGSDGAMGRLPFFGVAWYRKHLSIPAADAGKRIFLELDGSMSYTAVWCNGQIVGGWPYGYTSWRVDLTPYVKTGADNVLAIRLDNPPRSSRWYPGGGIYRNVWLTKTGPVHIAQWGTFVTTPEVTVSAAAVTLKVTVDNHAKADVNVSLATQIFALDANGLRAAAAVAAMAALDTPVAAGKSATVETKTSLANPKLWSPKTPNRYLALTTVTQNGAVVDSYETPFGIRTFKYDPNAGLFVNGEHVKLNGVCDHHDLGALGTAINFRALQRQVELLKDMGCNALRTSHNPPAPELLDLADRYGMIVLDESFDTWGSTKRANDYGGANLFNVWHEQDQRALVRRDRNHPSVFAWSIGNEIAEQSQGANSAIAKELAAIVHSEDPTRPVTAACDGAESARNGFSTLLDAMGFNYKPDNYIRFHESYPAQFFFSTESASTISSRGEYFFPVVGPGFGAITGRGGRGGATGTPPPVSQDNPSHQMSSYDLYYPSWATSPDHEFYGQDHCAAVAGEFVWTGFDYIGEPTPWGGGSDPSRSSYFGIIDLAGFPKDRFYSYQAQWRPDFPMAHILPHWNWPDRAGQVTPVHVYTSGDEAELFLNGKSLGRKKKIFEGSANQQLNGQPAYRIRWDDVAYTPGELKVVTYKAGKEWATDTVKTTGAATQLFLKPDRAAIAGDGHDLSFVTLTVADKEGLMVPRSKNPITFEISGPGEIVVTDNGDATDLVGFSSKERKAFNGLALAIVKAKRGQAGIITVTAKSEGLTTASTKIELK
ncbi:MAG TPA: beta-galactosidase GalB [Dongiaceae bacterium]|nr:beta-galactosidase GalB [Dongiaceae bacterium]